MDSFTKKQQLEQATTPAKTSSLVRAGVIAKHFDVTPRTVTLWAQNGIIPSVRLGGAVRFNLEAVLEAVR